jgi:chromosome transmission fidelity protein 1
MRLTVSPLPVSSPDSPDLIDTLLSIYSTSLSSIQLGNAISQLTQYLARFRSRLKPVHALWIRQTLSVLVGLVKVCDETIKAAATNPKAKAEMLETNALMARVGGGNDQVNLMEMVKYLKESKLARKVSGYVEKTAEEAASKGERPKRLKPDDRSESREERVRKTRLDRCVSPPRGFLAVIDGCAG